MMIEQVVAAPAPHALQPLNCCFIEVTFDLHGAENRSMMARVSFRFNSDRLVDETGWISHGQGKNIFCIDRG
jgi:hypothetical protein